MSDGLRRLAIILAATFVLSLASSLWLTEVDAAVGLLLAPDPGLGAGAGRAPRAAGGAARWVPARAAPWLGWAGVALVVLSGLVLDEATKFPGVAALLPTIGSALVIAAGLRAATSPTENRAPASQADAPAKASPGRDLRRFLVPAAVLGLAPLRFFGRISYSLYLWHWPILVLPEVAVGHTLPGTARLGLVILSVVAAWASQRWVEDPVRHGRFVGLASRRSLVMAGVLPMVVAICSISLGAAAIGRAAGSGTAVGGDVGDVPLPTLIDRAAVGVARQERLAVARHDRLADADGPRRQPDRAARPARRCRRLRRPRSPPTSFRHWSPRATTCR